MPVAVGFGIRDAKSAARIAEFSDAVVIGSRIVEEIEQSPRDQVVNRVGIFLRSVRAAMDAGVQEDE
jgi:tryptophan synthase alpha chain